MSSGLREIAVSSFPLVSWTKKRRVYRWPLIRGVVAMWRLSVQDKSPEAVAMLRRFKIGNDGQAVTVKGTLTGDFLRSLSDKRAVK